MGKLSNGYVQVYTGDGKGKTTAALGLALRAAGFDMKVYVAQFIKGMKYNEIKALEKLANNVTVEQFGNGCFIRNAPAERDIESAKSGLEKIKKVLVSGEYDIVILDEINIALYFGLLTVDEVVELISLKPNNVELVLTGRRVHPQIIELADLVTEMREIKHYFKKGIMARQGIEK